MSGDVRDPTWELSGGSGGDGRDGEGGGEDGRNYRDDRDIGSGNGGDDGRPAEDGGDGMRLIVRTEEVLGTMGILVVVMVVVTGMLL